MVRGSAGPLIFSHVFVSVWPSFFLRTRASRTTKECKYMLSLHTLHGTVDTRLLEALRDPRILEYPNT